MTAGRELSTPDPARCAACGALALAPHLTVKHELGEAGLIPTTDRFGSALSDIARCQRCGHMQLARLPDVADLLEEYADAASMDYAAEEAGQRQTARGTLEIIERHVVPGALLDVGCWLGFLLDEARGRGWRTTGLEPSRFASEYAREHLGLDVQTADLFEAPLRESQFSAVILGDVLEHFPDPAAALERIRTVMEPGGVIYLALPDAGSRVARIMGRRWWSVIPTHVHYFTRNSLRTLLERQRWEVLEISTAPKAFSVGYYLGRVAGYSKLVSRSLVDVASRSGLADRLWAPDFRDRMAVVARAEPSGSVGT